MLATFRLTAASLCLASLVSADTPAPGYEIEVLPNGGSFLTAPLSTGEFVGLSGGQVARFAADGTLITQLHSWGLFNTSAPNGIVIDPTESFAVVCRDNGAVRDTHRVDLANGTTNFVSFASSHNPLFEPAGTLLMPTTDGLGTWYIGRLDLDTGQYTQTAAGFGGPHLSIDFDAAGNLYVAHSTGGTSKVERFDAALVASGGLIVEGAGALVVDAIPGTVYAMTVSPNGRNYFAFESLGLQNTLVQLGKGGRRPLADVSSSIFYLQLIPHAAPGAQVLGGPRLPGELIYQGQPGGVWERKLLRVEGSSASGSALSKPAKGK